MQKKRQVKKKIELRQNASAHADLKIFTSTKFKKKMLKDLGVGIGRDSDEGNSMVFNVCKKIIQIEEVNWLSEMQVDSWLGPSVNESPYQTHQVIV